MSISTAEAGIPSLVQESILMATSSDIETPTWSHAFFMLTYYIGTNTPHSVDKSVLLTPPWNKEAYSLVNIIRFRHCPSSRNQHCVIIKNVHLSTKLNSPKRFFHKAFTILRGKKCGVFLPKKLVLFWLADSGQQHPAKKTPTTQQF